MLEVSIRVFIERLHNIKYNLLRINKITKYLNDNAYSDISSLLEGIEELINERR